MNTAVKDTKGSWIYVAPVSGLKLTKSVNNEVTVQRVTFVTMDRLVRVRKRFGFTERISELKKNGFYSRFFEGAGEMVAVVRVSGKPAEITTNALRLIEEALEIISVSQLGFSKRRHNSFPTIRRGSAKRIEYICLNSKNRLALSTVQISDKLHDLTLGPRWLKFQKSVFFIDLLRLLNKELDVSHGWRKNLQRAAQLIGQSMRTDNLAQAFLLNMIAIESLLTDSEAKYVDVLPKRIEAFIGWVGFWHVQNYESRIREVYRKRCSYVHDGNADDIEISDLLFTDDLLLNLLSNLIHHHKIFRSKSDVICFAQKVEAEHILGIDPRMSKIRPRTLQFMSPRYTNEDLSAI